MHSPRAPLRRDTRVFISAVSRELGTVRQLVKKALEDSGYHTVEQTTFPLDYRDVVDKLRLLLASCDAVIHIAGQCFGAEPPQQPAGTTHRSYTQLEYALACELGKPVYVFITDDAFPTDPHTAEEEEHSRLQAEHRQALMQTGQDYCLALSREDIDQKVRSLHLQVELLTAELTRTDDRVVATGRRLGRWSGLILVLVLVMLGTLSYLVWQGKQQQQQARTVNQVTTGIAERFLDKLLTNKDISAEEARRRALDELPALVGLPAKDIEQLLAGKIAVRVQDTALSPLERARAALAVGNYEAVFVESAKQRVESRELAILEGTAALARFRNDPQPSWQAKALAAFQRALALSEVTTQPVEWADAAIWVAYVLADLARYAEAEPLLRHALQLRESQDGPEHPHVAHSLNNLAALYRAQGQYAEAEPLYQRALAIWEKALGPEHPHVAHSLNNLAELYDTQGRYAEAEPRYQRALAMREKALGPEHPDVATSLNNLAVLYRAQGQYAEAEPLYQRALAIGEKALGPKHPHVATSLNNLAELYDTQGRYAEAEPLYQRALAMREKAFGPEHPDVAHSLNNLAVLYDTQSRYAEAEPLYQRALAIGEKAFGPEHPDVATSLNNLAELYRAQSQYAEAEPLYQRALAMREKALGPEHPDVVHSLNNLAALYRAQGQYAEAEPLYQRALAMREKALGPKHPHVGQSLNSLAMLYHTQGRYAEAEPLYQRALAIGEKAFGPEHPNVATVGENYAALLRATTRDGEAAQLEARWSAQQPPRAWLGLQLQRSIELPGCVVEQVMAASPAAHAGIQPHDVIVRFNGQDVPDSETLLRLVGAAAVGTTVDVEIIHDGQRRTIPVTLEQRPPPRP